MARYLRILRRRGAAAPFAAAVVARLPISMAPLGIVLLIQSVRGSYAIAGLVTAALALGGALAAPGWGRLLDRVGQPWVIGPTGPPRACCWPHSRSAPTREPATASWWLWRRRPG
jgi:MFS family permease